MPSRSFIRLSITKLWIWSFKVFEFTKNDLIYTLNDLKYTVYPLYYCQVSNKLCPLHKHCSTEIDQSKFHPPISAAPHYHSSYENSDDNLNVTESKCIRNNCTKMKRRKSLLFLENTRLYISMVVIQSYLERKIIMLWNFIWIMLLSFKQAPPYFEYLATINNGWCLLEEIQYSHISAENFIS